MTTDGTIQKLNKPGFHLPLRRGEFFMKPRAYRDLRKTCCTIAEVSLLLGVDRSTIFRREHGDITITREAVLAIQVILARSTLEWRDDSPCGLATRKRNWNMDNTGPSIRVGTASWSEPEFFKAGW